MQCLFADKLLLSLQDQITITGYEHKAIAACKTIQAIVDELEEMISEDITLDSRVHARIIGARGKGIRKIMEEFKVRQTFRFFKIVKVGSCSLSIPENPDTLNNLICNLLSTSY